MSSIKKRVISLYLILFFLNTGYTQTAPDDTLCAPNPSKEAVALYRYLLDMKGKKILSGQQDSPWGIDEFSYLNTNTGKLQNHRVQVILVNRPHSPWHLDKPM